ncbi:murein transglycosylase A [Marinagarivorans algicola]|uniref:murein transglycosylase A n=1 Tax=Marinagarivorans algicola TaxID=1513270 RepID=UPI0037363D50
MSRLLKDLKRLTPDGVLCHFARSLRVGSLLLTCFVVVACQSFESVEPTKHTESGVAMSPSRFELLPHWPQERHLHAFRALMHSCPKILKQSAQRPLLLAAPMHVFGDLQKVCQAKVSVTTGAQAKTFFETYFKVYAVTNNGSNKAFFTGYYEPQILATRQKQAGFTVPLRAPPSDIVTVDLGAFDTALAGKKLYGRLDANQLKPYWTRADINSGALGAQHDKPIAWVANDVDKFFLQVQGSGLLVLADGQTLRVGFAGRNGHPYTAIGKPLIERGELERETISMQTIRAWLLAHPSEAMQVMNLNASYIFFSENTAQATVGAQGVPLTPEHSIAIDPQYWGYGLPLYITADVPQAQASNTGARAAHTAALARLVIAQDTGSAIKGALRGDFFWGSGSDAAIKAGQMKANGILWVLLPKQS